MAEDTRTPPAPGQNSDVAKQVNRENKQAGLKDTPEPKKN